MQVVVFIHRIVVIQQRMLVSQAHTGITILLEVATILSKGCDIVLCNIGIGIGNYGLVNPVGVVTIHKGHLGTSLQLTFPYRIRQHQLRGKKTAPGARFTQYKIILHLAPLNVLAVGIRTVPHEIEVEVDAQLAHLTIIIGVGEPAQRLRLLAGLVRVEVVDKGIVLEHVLVVNYLILAVHLVRQIGTHTQRVIIIYLPVHTSRIGQVIMLPRHRIGAILTEYLIRRGDILDGAVLTIVLMIVIHRAKHINAVLAIVSTYFCLRTVEVITQVVLIGQSEVETEAFTLLTDSADAHYGSYLGIVLRTRIVDYLYIAYFLAAQTLQFVIVAHQSAVDIDKRRSLA